MLKLKDDNGKPLPKDVQKRVNDFLKRVERVAWFNPSPDLKKTEVDKQVQFTLKCFGVEAGIKYKKLETKEDWDSASALTKDSAWDSAWDSVRASARDLVWASAWDSAWDSASVSAWASVEILVLDKIKDKYPDGAFIQLFKLWEMGLYPCGVINGEFVIYAKPIAKDLFRGEVDSLPEFIMVGDTKYIKS